MANVTVRDIPDEVVRGLDARAAAAGRSREAEIRSILAESVAPRADWSRFKAAAELARRSLPRGPLSDSVQDLAEARAERVRGWETGQ